MDIKAIVRGGLMAGLFSSSTLSLASEEFGALNPNFETTPLGHSAVPPQAVAAGPKPSDSVIHNQHLRICARIMGLVADGRGILRAEFEPIKARLAVFEWLYINPADRSGLR